MSANLCEPYGRRRRGRRREPAAVAGELHGEARRTPRSCCTRRALRRALGDRRYRPRGQDARGRFCRRRDRLADRFRRVRARRRHRRGAAVGIAAGIAAIAAGGDQIVSGMALNLIAAGATPSLALAWFGQRGTTPSLPNGARLGPIALPLAQSLSEVPIVGRIHTTIICGHSLPVYLAWLAVPLTAFVLARTRLGLRVRAVGESPEAVHAAGLSVARLRFC